MKFGVMMFCTELLHDPGGARPWRRSSVASNPCGCPSTATFRPRASHPGPVAKSCRRCTTTSWTPSSASPSAATATKSIKLATGICLVIQRDPIQVAKEVATLDQISKGRFVFGIGAGWNAEEMADHGTEFKSRFKVMSSTSPP